MRAGRRRIATLLTIACSIAGSSWGQVEEEDLGELEMEVFAPREPTPVDGAARDLFLQADRQLRGDDLLGGGPMLDAAIEALEPLAAAANPPLEGRSMLARVLTARAQLRLDRDDIEGAVDDLRRAVTVMPSLDLDRDRASPSIAAQFDAIRDEMVGVLDVETIDPPDLELRIDDRLVPAAVGPLGVLAGSRTLRARRPGYTPYAVSIDVPAGSTTPLAVALERTGPVLRVVTRPAGAVVAVDGIVRGRTSGTADDGALPQGSAAAAVPTTFSATFQIVNIPLGNHRLEVTLDGHRPFRAPLTIREPIDYDMPPVVLESERGRLLLRGLSGDARVHIDGTQVEVERHGDGGRVTLAPGSYELVIDRGAARMFTQHVRLADRQTIELDVRLRPGLAFLGVLGGDRDAAARVDRLIETAGRGTGRWTLVDRASAAEAVLAARALTADVARSAGPGDGIDWTAIQRHLDTAAPGLLYVLAVLSDDLLATHVDLLIWPAAPGPARPDRVRFAVAEAETGQIGALLERNVRLQRPWLGAQVIDSNAAEHPLVLTVIPNGPAARAGLAPGDELVSIAGTPVRRASELAERVEAAEAGEPIAVGVRSAAGERTAEIVLGGSPVIFDHRVERSLNAVAYADLALLEGEVSDAERWVVQLNRAKIYMHAGDWIEAARELRAIRAPDDDAGVGSATVDYWLGVALAAAGPAYRETAIDAFERAAGVPGARLFHHDGPWVAPRARARRHALTDTPP